MPFPHHIPAINDALRVCGHPSPDDTPTIRRHAWNALKSQRGQPVIQSRLPIVIPQNNGDAA